MTPPEAPFDHPWQAELFALTLALHKSGSFEWAEWTAVFGPRVQEASADAYWVIWSEALVVLLQDKGIAAASDVAALAQQWQDAARATPHGQPITLP